MRRLLRGARALAAVAVATAFAARPALASPLVAPLPAPQVEAVPAAAPAPAPAGGAERSAARVATPSAAGGEPADIVALAGGTVPAGAPATLPFSAPLAAPRLELLPAPAEQVAQLDGTPAGNRPPPEPEVAPPLAPSTSPRPYTPARSKAEIEAERILFPDLAGPPEAGDHYGPPLLLPPAAGRGPRERPLVLAPSLATNVPIPGAGAANCMRRDEKGRFMGWMDHQQCVFSGRALATARWVDDFFGDWYDDEAAMTAHLILHTALDETGNLDTRVALHASATLPNAQRRFRLILTDDTEDNAVVQDLRRPLATGDRGLTAALRWIASDHGTWRADFDVGARDFNPPEVFARYRLAKTWSLSPNALARLTQTLRYGSDSGERYTPELVLERALDERSELRFTNYYDYRHLTSTAGFNFSHALAYSRALTSSRSYSYGVSLNGRTRPEWRGESWGPWAIYRSPFLRPWLYYEVEPHYTWFRDRDWQGEASLLLRVEMQFGWK